MTTTTQNRSTMIPAHLTPPDPEATRPQIVRSVGAALGLRVVTNTWTERNPGPALDLFTRETFVRTLADHLGVSIFGEIEAADMRPVVVYDLAPGTTRRLMDDDTMGYVDEVWHEDAWHQFDHRLADCECPAGCTGCNAHDMAAEEKVAPA